MKWFLTFLAIGLTASEKLDRTYLPPPGAAFAGGTDDIQAPFEVPTLPTGGTPIKPAINGQTDFGQPPQGPVTTTSYAFSQTTYPSVESYETTLAPINPVTGLPIQNIGQPNDQQYNPNLSNPVTGAPIQNIGQPNIQQFNPNLSSPVTGAPIQNIGQPNIQQYNPNLSVPQNQDANGNYISNVQPGFISQVTGPDGRPINIPGSNIQLPGSNTHLPGSHIQTPGSTQQPGLVQDFNQYQPSGQITNQFPGQNVINPTIQIPGSQATGGNQGLIQYPGQAPTAVPSHPSTALPHGTTEPTLQGTYTGQPINVQDVNQPQYYPGHQNQAQIISSPHSVGNQHFIVPGENNQGKIISSPLGNQNLLAPGQNIYQPTTTATPSYPSSTSSYSSVRPTRPERPQATADRNAVIINYENVRTPNGYSYSYDTSNGIHADESGIVDDGTKAQGSYSYTGDDGKVYSVFYTADENGFQPRGDHLPTPPPIPEAIKKVIEQAARDKEAGIFDDGSYDEDKYGYKDYYGKKSRPQKQNRDKFNKNQAQNEPVQPIAGIIDGEYDEDIVQDQISDNVPGNVDGAKKIPATKYPSRQPSHKMTSGKLPKGQLIHVNRRISSGNGGNEPSTGLDDKQDNSFGIKYDQKQDLGNASNAPYVKEDNTNERNNNKYQKPSGPNSGIKTTKYTYPGSHLEESEDNDHFADGRDSFAPVIDDVNNQNIGGVSRPYRPGQSLIKQSLKQRPNSNQRPGTSSNVYIKGKKPQLEQNVNQGDVNDFVDKQIDYDQNNGKKTQIPNHHAIQQEDENGYYYNTPQTQGNRFPSRFKDQQVSSTTEPMKQKMSSKVTTPRPFLTPEVYNQQTNRNENIRQPTTLEPFMTSRVTTPSDTYTDYEDGDGDYETDIDTDEEDNVTKPPSRNVDVTKVRPHPSIQTTQKPQFGERTHVTQQGIVTPGHKVDYAETITPSYSRVSTYPSPTQNSRFGTTEIPKGTMRPQKQRRPSNEFGNIDTTTAVGRPVSSQDNGLRKPGGKYQTGIPSSRYPNPTVVSGSVPNGELSYNNYDSREPFGQKATTPQVYSTTTTTPTTKVPGTFGYQPVSQAETPGSYQPALTQSFQNGYRYDKPKYSTTARPFNPVTGSHIAGTTPSLIPNNYQTTYEQGPTDSGNSITTTASTRPGSFILSEPGSITPAGTYQTGNQYGPTTPQYTTTIGSSTPGSRQEYGAPTGSTSPGSYVSQASPSTYENRPSGSIYSTSSPSTIGTTPSSFISSTTPVYPTQEYPTTQRAGFPSQIQNQSPLVDGFGRPIFEQQPSYSLPGQGQHNQYTETQYGQQTPTTAQPIASYGIPGNGIGNVDGQSPNYPGYYDQQKIIGEDFSGPKQPQRFDPQTGYHYK